MSSTYTDPGIFDKEGEGGPGRKKKLHCLEKNSDKVVFLVLISNFLNSFSEGGLIFLLFDLILFVPSTIFHLYTPKESSNAYTFVLSFS